MQHRSIQALLVDVVPGTIWSRLHYDVCRSTVQAIELMIAELENATVERARPDRTAAARSSKLHQHFSHLASLGRDFGTPEWRLVKPTSSFRTPAARTGCGFPLDVPFETLRLSQRHADAEDLLFRHMQNDLRALLEEVGNALPPEIPDGPVMVHRPFGGFVACIGAHLDPDPVAKWL